MSVTATRRTVLAGAAALAACQPKQIPEDILRVGLPGGPDSLDPYLGQFAAAALIYRQIHAPLAGYHDRHGLAASWRADDSLTRWRATLREGLLWSNGEKLTAKDVLWNLRHGADPASRWPDIGDLTAIRGAMEIALGQAGPETLGVTAPDARTLDFQLVRPMAEFPDALREFYPVNLRALAVHGARWTQPENFVGAGPYLPTAESQLSLSLRRNPNYHGAASVSIPRVEASVVEDSGARVRLFRSGDLDMALDPPANRLDSLREMLGDQVHAYPAPRLVYLKVNHARPPLADPRVRRALNMAIDRTFIAEEIIGAAAEPAWTIAPGAGSPLRGAPLEARMKQAADLIAEAGYGPDNPLHLNLLHSGEDRARIAVALADDWGRIGVDVSVQASEATGLYAAISEGRFDLVLARFDRGLRSGDWRWLEPFKPGGFAANFGWEDPNLSKMIESIQGESDPQRRAALVSAADGLAMKDAHIIPLLRESALWLIASRVTGADGEQPVFWSDLALKNSAG